MGDLPGSTRQTPLQRRPEAAISGGFDVCDDGKCGVAPLRLIAIFKGLASMAR